MRQPASARAHPARWSWSDPRQSREGLQADHSLTVDGIVGPATFAALNEEAGDLVPRSRIWSAGGGCRADWAVSVIANVPEYRLWVMQEGESPSSRRAPSWAATGTARPSFPMRWSIWPSTHTGMFPHPSRATSCATFSSTRATCPRAINSDLQWPRDRSLRGQLASSG